MIRLSLYANTIPTAEYDPKIQIYINQMSTYSNRTTIIEQKQKLKPNQWICSRNRRTYNKTTILDTLTTFIDSLFGFCL